MSMHDTTKFSNSLINPNILINFYLELFCIWLFQLLKAPPLRQRRHTSPLRATSSRIMRAQSDALGEVASEHVLSEMPRLEFGSALTLPPMSSHRRRKAKSERQRLVPGSIMQSKNSRYRAPPDCSAARAERS